MVGHDHGAFPRRRRSASDKPSQEVSALQLHVYRVRLVTLAAANLLPPAGDPHLSPA